MATAADPAGNPVWIPTDAFDPWCALPTAERWVALVRAWLESPRLPGLVGSRDPAGKAWNALAPELSAVHQVESRQMTLAVLRDLPDGEVLAAGTGLPTVVQRVAWQRPRRPRTRADQVAWAVDEAAALGVSGLNGLASYARALLGDDEAGAVKALAAPAARAGRPRPAPGRPHRRRTRAARGPAGPPAAAGRRRRVARRRDGLPLHARARCAARWTPGGRQSEVHEFIGSVSRTPVPQPLSYLVDDTARTFGTIRVGHAEAFLRADDEAALSELLHHPKAATLGLRRIAPTVVVSSTPLDVLLPRLRELGAAPVVEASDGTVHVARPDSLRRPHPRDRRAAARRAARAARETAQGTHAVTAIRAGDRAAASRPASAAATLSPSGSMAALREAIEAGRLGADRLRRQPRQHAPSGSSTRSASTPAR